jgi:uncharacterized membrane protein YebE (DUF533 family)
MVGFFEHQYLSYKKNHIKNLLALARIDGTVHESEQKMIFKIGKGYGLTDSQILALINSEGPFAINVPDNDEDKMNVLYDLMLVLYADGVVDQHEVAFCESVVEKFGMEKGIVTWLIEDVFVKGVPPGPSDWLESIKLIKSASNRA